MLQQYLVMGISKEIRQQNFKSNYEKAVINVLFTHNWLRDQYKGFFDQWDIKSQHYNILRIIKGRHPEPAYPGEIKEVMLDKSPDLTRLLDKLVRLNLIQRELCPTNRRKMEITLTNHGLKTLEDIMTKQQEIDNSRKIELSEDEAEQLSNLLDKLRS